MANSSREALLHSAMDQLVSRVRKWKAGNGPVGPNQAQDLCHKHKDDIYKCFQESGLQAWEFHTMLHRAAEYGLVEDMKGLWSEVATTFLQMRSGSGHGSFDAQGQHMQPGFGQPQQQQAGPPGSAPKANGVYGAPYTPNGRSSNGSVASTGNKPPGLNRQGQQGLAYAAAPAARSPQDDIAGTSTDQHSSRKQQQQQQQQQAKPGSRSSSVGKGAAMQGGNQQQQGRGPAGKQQAAGTAAGAAAAGGKAAAAAPAGPAAAAAAPDAGGAMSNGYISAWRNGPDAASSKPGPSLMSGFMSGAGFQQQQLQQQQASMEPLQQGMDQQQQEEPLDLLPLGLLDDVYDQGDAVVDGPAKGKASGKPAAKQQAQQQGKQQQSAKPRGAQQQQQQQAQQQGRSQQKAPAAQQQPAQNSRSVSAPSASSHQQQQQQADALSAFEGVSVVGPLSPTARPFAPSLSVGPFSSQRQQQQQQQQPQLGGFDVTSPLAGLQQRASMEALHQQQQQQQILMLQQQARYYQQQQMGMWGSSAPPMPYMHPLGAPGMPMQPPPPPRNSAAAAAASGSSQPGAIAAAAAAAQQAPAKPGYAAVAAGLTAAQGSNSGSNALAAAPAGISSDAGSSLGDMSHLSAGAPMSYRGSLGLSAAPGGPVGHPAATDTDRRLLVNVVPGSAAQQQQQQQMQAPSGALGAESAAHSSLLSASSGPLQQQQGLLGLQQQAAAAGATAGGLGSSNGSKGLMPAGLSLFQGASYDSALNGPLLGSSSTGAAVGAGPLSPYPSPMHRSLSGVPSGGASPALTSLAASGPQGSSSLGMAPMLLPPSALGAIGEPVGSHAHLQQQQSAPAAPRPAWGGAPGRAVAPPPPPAAAAQEQLQQDASAQSNSGVARQAGAVPTQQQQQQEMQVGSLGSVGSGRGIVPDSSSSSASSSVTAPAAASVSSPHSIADSSPNALGRTHAQPQQQQGASPQTAADAAAVQQQSPQQRAQIDSTVAQQSPARQQQQQVPASPGKPLTWAQKLKKAEATGGPTPNSPASAAGAAGNGAGWGAAAGGAHPLVASGSSSGPRIAPAPKSELSAAGAAAGSTGGMSSRGMHKTTGQALLAAAKQQEEEAAAAAAAAVPTYSEAAALEGLDETTAKAAVTAASRMPLPAKLIQAWRSGMCLGSLIKLLQSQRPDLATAVNDRIKGWLCQDCDRSTAECLVLFVLANLRRDWHMTAKNPGAFLMGLLQHRAALIGGSGLSRKLLETARNFPNVAVYIDSDVLQELGDMEPELRGFVMDEYMCKQRHDWPEGLKFPSQCLLSCMRSIRYADPAVHRAYIQLLASRPDLSKACNGVILYGLCKCDKATGSAAVKRLSELPEAWTSAARVNASAFLYQKVQELCGGHGCY